MLVGVSDISLSRRLKKLRARRLVCSPGAMVGLYQGLIEHCVIELLKLVTKSATTSHLPPVLRQHTRQHARHDRCHRSWTGGVKANNKSHSYVTAIE
jgi:hypothetical protein